MVTIKRNGICLLTNFTLSAAHVWQQTLEYGHQHWIWKNWQKCSVEWIWKTRQAWCQDFTCQGCLSGLFWWDSTNHLWSLDFTNTAILPQRSRKQRRNSSSGQYRLVWLIWATPTHSLPIWHSTIILPSTEFGSRIQGLEFFLPSENPRIGDYF